MLSLTFCLSLMEPLPRIAIFVIVSSCSLFRELPLGPSSFPTKLNWNEKKSYTMPQCTWSTQWGMLQRKTLQRTAFINKIRILQRTKMLQRTRRNTVGRCSTRVRMTCRAFPLCLERHSSTLLSFVTFSYQFSSVICLFLQCTILIYLLHGAESFLRS